MEIRIETQKEISKSGEKGYRITKIRALTEEQLPRAYLFQTLSQKPREVVYEEGQHLIMKKKGGKTPIDDFSRYLHVEGWYTKEKMDEILNFIREAGQHLHDVNKELRRLKKEWKGKVVFIDGEIFSTKGDSNSERHYLCQECANYEPSDP